MITYCCSVLFVLLIGVSAVIWQCWCAERKEEKEKMEWLTNKIAADLSVHKNEEEEI